MAATYTNLYAAALREQETALTGFYSKLLALLLITANRHTRGGRLQVDGFIPDAASVISQALLSSDGNAYRVDGRGTVVPQSDYFRVLWRTVNTVAAIAVARHTAVMRGEQVSGGSEQATTDYLSSWYSPPTQRVLDDGKRLPERLASLSANTVRMVTQLAESNVNTFSAALTQALTPTHFDGKRLARGEALLAYTWIGLAAAALNPRVAQYEVYLAAGHPCCDRCDGFAQGSPYPVTRVSALPPYHANCVCGVRWLTGRRSIPVNVLTPLAGAALASLLLREQH